MDLFNSHFYLLIYSTHKILRNGEIFKKLENEIGIFLNLVKKE
jgi:hypothetical protein